MNNAMFAAVDPLGLSASMQAHHRFVVLDGWRGVAAICVAFFHFAVYSHVSLSPFVNNSYLFVDFFFVLSGFVISYTYAGRLGSASQIVNFVIRRFGRLWPLHAAILLFLVVVESIKLVAFRHQWINFNHVPFDSSGYMSWSSVPANFLLVQSLGFNDHRSWNVPSWSISTEFWTYLVLAILCLTGRRAMIAGAALLASLGFAVVFFFSTVYMNVSQDYGFFRCLYGFFLGYFAYLLWRRLSVINVKWVGHWEIPSVVAAIAFIRYAGDNIFSELAPLLFGVVVLVFSFEKGIVSRLLRWHRIERLGEYSYSIYMVHFVIMDFLIYFAMALEKVVHRTFHVVLPDHMSLSFASSLYVGDLVAIIYVVAILLVSALTHRYIEMPGRRFFNTVANRWRRPQLAT